MKPGVKYRLLCSLALASAALALFLSVVLGLIIGKDYIEFTTVNIICVIAVFFALSFFLAVSVIFFFSNLSSYRSAKSLNEIRETLEIFAQGDFSVRLKKQPGGKFSELTDTVNNMAQRLQLLEIMRADFLTNVSHDLKTPMTVIAGYVTNIINGSIPREREEHYLELIKKEIFRLSGLIGTLLTTSRIESGDYELNKESFDICEAARIAIISKIEKIEEGNFDFSFEPEDEEIYAYGDSEEISQVLVNLLDNAVKFTPKKGKISINATCVNQTVTMSVYNQCDGIPEEDKPFVFDRFFKGDRTRGMEKDSFGLGLYVCKKIMDAHGTEILLDSEPGYCRMSFALPAGQDR